MTSQNEKIPIEDLDTSSDEDSGDESDDAFDRLGNYKHFCSNCGLGLVCDDVWRGDGLCDDCTD